MINFKMILKLVFFFNFQSYDRIVMLKIIKRRILIIFIYGNLLLYFGNKI